MAKQNGRTDAELIEARATLAAAEERARKADDDASALAAAVADGDPDAEASFAKLVARRDAARAKAEALHGGVSRARRALAEAEERAAAAEREAVVKELATIKAKIDGIDAATTGEVREARDRIAARSAELRALVTRAGELASKMGLSAPSLPTPFWASVGPGAEFMHAVRHPDLHREAESARIAATPFY